MKAVVCVTNDVFSDQRVNRVCETLRKCGYEVEVVGRMRKNSPGITGRSYKVTRMKLLTHKKVIFYAEYNFRLFLKLLFSSADLIYANDLDTLPAAFLAGRLRNKKLIYDSHEFFCHVPELVHRPSVQRVWLQLEKFIVPRLKRMITVNASIAGEYEKAYAVDVQVVRNVPIKKFFEQPEFLTRSQMGLPEDKKIILLQGAGINVNRGAEEAVQTLQYLPEDVILLIIGSGDVFKSLQKLAAELEVAPRVIFKERMPFELLVQHTRVADIGISLDKGDNPNYCYSLPNKLFDYIHAGIPVVTSDLVEVRKIVQEYDIGLVAATHEVEELAKVFHQALYDDAQRAKWKQNLKRAAAELRWELEEKKLIEVIQQA